MEFSRWECGSGLPFPSPQTQGLLYCRWIFYCLSHQGILILRPVSKHWIYLLPQLGRFCKPQRIYLCSSSAFWKSNCSDFTQMTTLSLISFLEEVELNFPPSAWGWAWCLACDEQHTVKWFCGTAARSQEALGLLARSLFSDCLLPLREAGCRFVSRCLESSTWRGTEASSQQPGRNEGGPSAAWLSLEGTLPSRSLRPPLQRQKPLQRQTQPELPAKPLPDSWPAERTR